MSSDPTPEQRLVEKVAKFVYEDRLESIKLYGDGTLDSPVPWAELSEDNRDDWISYFERMLRPDLDAHASQSRAMADTEIMFAEEMARSHSVHNERINGRLQRLANLQYTYADQADETFTGLSVSHAIDREVWDRG